MKRYWFWLLENFFGNKKVVIFSDKYVKTYNLPKSMQVLLALFSLFIGLSLAGVIILSAKFYDKIDSKERKIYQMTQDQAFAKEEMINMIDIVDKMNVYFEKINKSSIININKKEDIITAEASENEEQEDVDERTEKTNHYDQKADNVEANEQNSSESSIDSNIKEDIEATQQANEQSVEKSKKKSTKLKIKPIEQSLKTLNNQAKPTDVNNSLDTTQLRQMEIIDLINLLRDKINKWHESALKRYFYIQNILSDLGLLTNCSNISMMNRIANATGDVIDSIKRVAGFSKNETDLLAKVKIRLCNASEGIRYKLPNQMTSPDSLITSSTFLSSLINLEEIINNIPLGKPLRNIIRYSSGFGMRKHPIYKVIKKHEGMDLIAKYGANIFSVASGYVTRAGWYNGYGWTVDVQHEYGFMTRYAHLSSIGVRLGQRVSPGQYVGKEGSSGGSVGAHLHFEIRINNVAINPKRFLHVNR